MKTPANETTANVTGMDTKSSGTRIVGIVVGVLVLLVAAGLVIFRDEVFGQEPPRPSDPFEGTAAAQFVTGEDAIELPTAAEVPGFTTEQVAAALQTVKAALVAGRLDETMLYDHDRGTFDALFSGYGVDLLEQLEAANAFTIVATRIAPGHTLSDHPIRFHGEITFEGQTLESGIRVLVVHTEFIWVYPFSGELRAPGDHLVTLRDSIDWIFPDEAEVDPEYIGMYVGSESRYTASGIDCALIGEGLVALGQAVEVDADVADPDDVFDPQAPWDIPSELACQS